MGDLIRGYDWTNNPLGNPETWLRSLISAPAKCRGGLAMMESFSITIHANARDGTNTVARSIAWLRI